MPTLTLAVMLRTINRTARTMITTYLGHDAAQRVLAGNIVRGRAESIRAVVWFSDLVGFTRISDKVGAEGCSRSSTTTPKLRSRRSRARRPCAEIHRRRAARDLPRRGGGLGLRVRARRCDRTASADRRTQRAPHRFRPAGTDTHIALHVGELLYGNVGGPRRLDFTVLGPAVNEAARIEALCGSLDQR